jgi:LysR family transcriptional regulator, hydrogen peroxide-inducible genes activator
MRPSYRRRLSVPARRGNLPAWKCHQIRYFLAVADTLNFTRAAEQCHVSQPALTRAIQQLEEELGGLLLRRERKLTHLTDFGRLLVPHLRQLAALPRRPDRDTARRLR